MNMPNYEFVSSNVFTGKKEDGSTFTTYNVYLVGPNPSPYGKGEDIAFRASCQKDVFDFFIKDKAVRGSLYPMIVTQSGKYYNIVYVG